MFLNKNKVLVMEQVELMEHQALMAQVHKKKLY